MKKELAKCMNSAQRNAKFMIAGWQTKAFAAVPDERETATSSRCRCPT